ncbi:MAG TPA: prepilin-type N-terminal cleavage/methylation domain-containing protein [Candidatus Sumerlaeota bacterium]|nr:MAG: hypothetical protein BWZ08_02065 [candidate division BRC1 bacterium ADurb.BinA292]HOE96728.1 prepilin-type N-terminal cleavage/methylation domain-containing protein [Candidatus Sumerlaeota bacterium]HPK02983.1 prepilin-type N-terminal cleavage/methylation domain-containing protein [Candidatus Sumerlaeota bacterium]
MRNLIQRWNQGLRGALGGGVAEKRGARRGFSIIEILVALAILVLAAGGVYHQFFNIDRLGRMRLNEIQGRLLAQQRLEELRALPYARLAEWEPGETATPLGDNLKYAARTTIEPGPGDVLKLTVMVSWRERGAEAVAGNSVTVVGYKGR